MGTKATFDPPVVKVRDDRLRMAHGTDWQAVGADAWIGHGQRMLVTDQAEYALLDLRLIEFDAAEAAGGQAETAVDG